MKIYLTGAENIGWALDTDIKLAKLALSRFASIRKCAANCDYVHSVSPNTTFERFAHHGERFISVFQGEPKRIFEKDNGSFYDFCKNKICVAQSKQAFEELKNYNIAQVKYIPYIADLSNFYYIADKISLRQKYNIESRKFVIGSFMRDSLGSNLHSPKTEKGADIFVQIVKQVCDKVGYEQILVLLGGPRRHWIRSALKNEGIKYTFIGDITDNDDMHTNILPAFMMNELLNVSDLILVSSRSEGGPRGILEAAATYTPIISTNVGVAGDVLNKRVIYNNISEAVEMLIRQIRNKEYSAFCEENYNIVAQKHSVKYVSALWKDFYFDQYKKHSKNRRHYSISINDYDKLYMIKKWFID